MRLLDDIKENAHYSITEASYVLGVHRCTVHRYIEQGYLPKHYHKATMRPYIRGRDLLRFARAEA